MRRPRCLIFVFPLLFGVICSPQTPGKPAKSEGSPPAALHNAELAENGHCREVLPMLKKSMTQVPERDLKRRLGMDGVRCAMTMNMPDEAVDFLGTLSREFPHDPEVLYFSTHAYSDLSIRASQELVYTAPSSYQVRELNAEALEQQGKWDDAAAEYRKILSQNPRLPGMHFRLARLLLSKPEPSPQSIDEAKRECEQELTVDPKSAGAEYVLGELAREDRQWDEAIKHFSRATKFDSSFADAFFGLGTALISADRFAEAIAPLEAYVKINPADPAGHFHLGTAYSRTAHKAEATKEFALYKEANNTVRDTKEKLSKGLNNIPPKN